MPNMVAERLPLKAHHFFLPRHFIGGIKYVLKCPLTDQAISYGGGRGVGGGRGCKETVRD